MKDMKPNKPKWDPTFKDRPLSWSQLSAFDWDKEEWYQRYVLFQKPAMSKEMEFGNMVDKRFQEDPTFFPSIPRRTFLQHKINVKFGKINMVAIIDSFEPFFEVEGLKRTPAIIDDLKTGKKKWDQKRIDESGQLTFYTFSLWLQKRVHPNDVKVGIWWIPTQENGDFSITQLKGSKPLHFESSRTMQDLLKFGQYINATVKEMDAYRKKR